MATDAHQRTVLDSHASDAAVVAALRRGDEAAFAALVSRHHSQLVRFARAYVADRDTAEEVVQECWLGVLRGLDRFEGRSSLRTWIYRILINRARTRGEREHRSMPFSAIDADDEAAVDLDRFLGADHPRWPWHWSSRPASWESLPEEQLLGAETLARVRSAIDELPSQQRQVIILRDVEGWSADEVCNTLELSETNQRVLLHRARSRVRRALEPYLMGQ